MTFVRTRWAEKNASLLDVSVADDSCLAFKQYLQDPQNTTLDDLIPCADLASSSGQYLQVREAMKSVISSVQNHQTIFDLLSLVFNYIILLYTDNCR